MNNLTVQEDPDTGDLFLELTEELMYDMGWSVGDSLVWEETNSGWTLSKKEENASTVGKTEQSSK